jgi:hypothetical protein
MSPRRQEDPEDFDPKPLRANGLPWKAVLGWSLPSFLVLYLLGAVPGLPSPLLGSPAARNSDGSVKMLLQGHEETSKAQLRLLRVICRGVWSGASEERRELQANCDR